MARRFVTLRLWHADCWMLELSERFPDVVVEGHGVSACADHVETDVHIRAASDEALDAALAAAPPEDVRRELLYVGDDHAEMYTRYPLYRSIFQTTREAGLLLVAPVVHRDGYEYWQVLADQETLPAAVERLRASAEVRVERVSDRKLRRGGADGGVLDRVGGALSARQLAVLDSAVRAGYYDWPRGKNVKTLARELGISGPTCLEHIRRAESRIVPAVLDELRRARDLSA